MTASRQVPVAAGTSITVRFRFFARYAELLGKNESSVTLKAPATVADAVRALRERVPGAQALPEHPLVALNREHVLYDRPVSDGDELALLPPLAGG
ncbi:Molybdopterin synthase sulfur carrier subunit [bacterium HR33]|nr:Molybdopterin synthase sulfur carrier subunit [bacterium HR33]